MARPEAPPTGRDALDLLLPPEEVEGVVCRLAGEVRRDYRERHPLLVGVLKGAFIFLADLVRLLDFPLQVEFVRVSTYGAGTTSSRRPRVLSGVRTPLQGRHVLLVEDIVDTGHTTAAVLRYLRRCQPASLKVCALLDKRGRREVPVPIHYRGLVVPDRFLVGYGLDYAEEYRHLRGVYALRE